MNSPSLHKIREITVYHEPFIPLSLALRLGASLSPSLSLFSHDVKCAYQTIHSWLS